MIMELGEDCMKSGQNELFVNDTEVSITKASSPTKATALQEI